MTDNSRDAEIDRLVDDAHEKYAVGSRSEAYQSLQQAMDAASETWEANDERLISILEFMAELRRNPTYGVKDEEPIPYILRALSIAEKALPPDAPKLGALYGRTGVLLRAAERLSEARDATRKAIDLFDRVGLPDEAAFFLGELIGVSLKLDPSEALPICQRRVAYEERTRQNQVTHFIALCQLGECLVLVGNGSGALTALYEAKEMLQRASRGAEHRWMKDVDDMIENARALPSKPSAP